MRAKKSTILMAVAWLLLGASAAQAQTEVILFKLTSLAAVYNNPSQRTMFRLDRPAFITKMFTYHWNDGRGAGAGQIGLRNAATGQMVGMWNAVGTQHMFDLTPGAAWPSRGDGPPMLHWAVQPNVEVPPGTYEIVDSDPGTWASNAEMGNRGCAWVFGVYGGGGHGQIAPSPGATPQVQPLPAGALSVSISPPRQTINSGEKAVTTANVTGGTPPYTYAWDNGTKQSQVVRGGVNWTMRSAGTRDIRVVVTDSAGSTAEAHAQIFVQEGGGGQVMPSPPATPQVQPTPPPSTAGGVYTLTAVTPDPRNEAVGTYQPFLARDGPGSGYDMISCSSGRAEKRWWSHDDGGVKGLYEFQIRWEWTAPPAQVRPGQVWPITGTVTVVKNNKPWPNMGGEISTGNYFWPGDPASIGPRVTNKNPSGYRATETATGTVPSTKADFDMNISNAEGCMFWYHYKWNPGGAYTQVVPSPLATREIRPAAQPGMMSVRITPTEQIVKSGDKAVTTADATGGTPPYSYAWYNGTKQSQVTRGSVTWTMGAAAGARDIRVVVTDSAGNTAEAHAQIVVR